MMVNKTATVSAHVEKYSGGWGESSKISRERVLFFANIRDLLSRRH